jgi:chemotaxis protein histidine kinase CheA
VSPATPDELRDPDGLLEEIHREFRDGLPDRVEAIRSALERLAGGYDAEVAEEFYRTAHSLKGTAPSFDADELVEPAAALAAAGLGWCEECELEVGEVSAAIEELERLSEAVNAFTARMEGGAAG